MYFIIKEIYLKGKCKGADEDLLKFGLLTMLSSFSAHEFVSGDSVS